MRNKLFFLLYMLGATVISAQERYFPPYYPTLSGLDEYAAWHLVYPDSLLRADVPGEAVCTLWIDKEGQVANREITATHAQFAQAAEKVVDEMKRWKPAWKDGVAVDTTVVIHVPFHPEAYRERVWRQQQVLEPCRGQVVDTPPLFPDRIRKLVLGNMQWPDPKVQTAVSVCRFTVDPQGHVGNVRIIINGKQPDFDKEAVRILSNFPRLVPAQRDGKSVAYDYFLTMHFYKLDLEYFLRRKEKERKDVEGRFPELLVDPSYPGGPAALVQFVNEHLRITPEMQGKGKKGRVIYSFEVDIDGTMKNFKLVRSLCPLMDAEALRVLQSVNKKWSRGYQYNTEKGYREFYTGQFTTPVTFKW